MEQETFGNDLVVDGLTGLDRKSELKTSIRTAGGSCHLMQLLPTRYETPERNSLCFRKLRNIEMINYTQLLACTLYS